MHYFDPTMDWPIELAQQNVPDILMIHSKVLNDSNAPWRTTADSDAWGTDWIQFSTADGAQNFVNLIFFDIQSVRENDKNLFTAYHSHLTRTDNFVGQYRATSSRTSFPAVSSSMLRETHDWQQRLMFTLKDM